MMPSKRVLSIWFPHLAIEHWAKTTDCPPDSPVALTVEGAHGPVIHAVTNAAAARGAQIGARLTDVRALDPQIVAASADVEGDRQLLGRLARWAGRWSPLVEVDGEDGLRLDITGVAHLFGGERGLLGDISERFAGMALTVRLAIAPTAGAAWALSHHQPCICADEDVSQSLLPLPVSALRLPPETVHTLEKLGLKTIAALDNVPRLALARRFRGADDVIDALDRAVGRKGEPLTAIAVDHPPRATVRMEEPVLHPEAALQALGKLIPLLVLELQGRLVGARRLSLTGYRVDGSIGVVTVATAIPSREPQHLQRLLGDKAATLDPQFGFDAFALTAEWTEPLDAAQADLGGDKSGSSALAGLVDRLSVKLGASAVRRPQAFQSHLPERASRWVPAIQGIGVEKAAHGHAGKRRPADATQSAEPVRRSARPQRLLDRPEAIDVIYATPEGMPRRFMWRRAVHDITRVEGPERIAPEWWRQPSMTRLRDYYRVEDAKGRRYWIYREGLIGDGRGGAPNWFIHGLFG